MVFIFLPRTSLFLCLTISLTSLGNMDKTVRQAERTRAEIVIDFLMVPTVERGYAYSPLVYGNG